VDSAAGKTLAFCRDLTIVVAMDWYLLIGATAILAQLLVVYYALANYHYVTTRLASKRAPFYRPRAALIVPCKGLDTRFTANIRSFLEQDYENYYLLFVVGNESDPAYKELMILKNEWGVPRWRGSSRLPSDVLRSEPRNRPTLDAGCAVCGETPAYGPLDVQVLVAGPSQSSSQKIHNLLHALSRVPADSEVLAFADSDVCVHEDWLRHLVHPLYVTKRGLTTGYRWFVPTDNNLASLAASAINAAVAQFLGNGLFNLAWGGSMAIRTQDFHRFGIPELWSQTLSDDLSLSRAVRRAGLRITFVPQCLVASFESFTWRRLCEFGRRQFLITRVYTPGVWWLGLFSTLGSVLGMWGAAAAAIYAGAVHGEHMVLYAAVALVFFTGQVTRAVLRQIATVRALREHLSPLFPAAVADVLGCWFWSIVLFTLMLSSAFGRTIRWRGIRYRLVSPTDIRILNKGSQTR